MAKAVIEHVNLTVSDPDRTADMLHTLFGWRIRWRGPAMNGGHTIHVGTDTHYIAVYRTADATGRPLHHAKGLPLNHVGIEVDDLDGVERRVLDYGLKTFSHDDYEPGRRFYFMDPDNIEYEIVSYTDTAHGSE